MPRVKRGRGGVALVVWALALLAFVPAAQSADGPELGVLHVSAPSDATLEIFDAGGAPLATVFPVPGQRAPRPFFLSPPSWSGDGQLLIAAGFAKPGSEGQLHLYAVPPEGGAPTVIPGSTNALYPVGLPDGQTVAFLRGRGSESGKISEDTSGHRVVHRTHARFSLWIGGIAAGKPRRVTPWRTDGFDVPISASPDGLTLAVSRVTIDRTKRGGAGRRSRVVLLDLRTGRAVTVGENVASAVFSPDGSRLALVIEHPFPRPQVRKSKGSTARLYGETDIAVKDLATGAVRTLTSGPALDGSPAWDPSGQRLAFVRLGNPLQSEAAAFGIGDSVYEVNADGSCLTRVLHEAGGGFTSPAWRPGPERGAGPLAC
ncbi:MAG: TolB family protein [Solirubrobacterales bacterium]